MNDINDTLIARSEELYRTVKSKSVMLVADAARERVLRGRGPLPQEISRRPAHAGGARRAWKCSRDANYLSEALYNLMTNAWEANVAAGHEQSPVSVVCYNIRLYTVLEVRDDGTGIDESERRKIFEPFYSSKNTNFNWGMGLYHVRTIVRSHLGTLQVENRKEGGAAFFILLPRYDGSTRREGRHRK